MTDLHDLKAMVRRNQLLGMWAAEKLGLIGTAADAYAKDLCVGTLDAESSDVFSKIRKEFDCAGVVKSDEQILRVMEELMLRASAQMPTARGGALDSAAVMLKRKLTR
jgi:hypothetical protein